ncbi:ABC transporter ATP-binding protein [Candidatus Cryosericum odellii]|jgi:ABC-2 type transport system ATP-binding protein|uniref:ABC transporter ATP-binding protein n=1 Tax=Candidatus Cryosericum odellii TaxID=2290917 RepID=A0A398D5H9_9BACT|nr:ABC transporter ATP-binding protein [Candidatus Cryosericum odellii]RIE06861.1 ABC transporter ATP-binding protein [Candidatus Cryosericum odellii]RIE07597.1 ABC transporter ATP-binding protein [Candidatus Cryosericum odellii]
MSMLVQISSLTKRYITTTALSDVTLEVPEGHIMGLLGPNGSGKTTLMKILAGLVSPTSGSVLVDGMAPGVGTKAVVSFLPDVNHLDRWMSVGEAGDFYADFYLDFERKRFEELLAIMRLTPGQKIGSLSKGMVEKARVSLVFSRRARLYVLDEPFGGLDPVARSQVLDALVANFRTDSSMILSTQMVADVERFFDDVVFLDGGRVVLAGDAEDLRTRRGASIEDIYREVYGHVEAC